jgi:hypothetical protein
MFIFINDFSAKLVTALQPFSPSAVYVASVKGVLIKALREELSKVVEGAIGGSIY